MDIRSVGADLSAFSVAVVKKAQDQQAAEGAAELRLLESARAPQKQTPPAGSTISVVA